MSFCGKKFRRIACENMEKLIDARSTTKNGIMEMLKFGAPVFTYKRINEDSFQYMVKLGDRSLVYTFKLGQEHEFERIDGSKLKMTYTMENEDVLNQVIKRPDGKVVHFRRIFRENEAEMIINIVGTDVKAKVMYEVVT